MFESAICQQAKCYWRFKQSSPTNFKVCYDNYFSIGHICTCKINIESYPSLNICGFSNIVNFCVM